MSAAHVCARRHRFEICTAQTQLVQLDVVVRDARGRAVSGLKQGDFEILDEGKPRAIAAFSEATRTGSASAHAAALDNARPAGRAIPALPTVSPRYVMLALFDDIHANIAELRRRAKRGRVFRKA